MKNRLHISFTILFSFGFTFCSLDDEKVSPSCSEKKEPIVTNNEFLDMMTTFSSANTVICDGQEWHLFDDKSIRLQGSDLTFKIEKNLETSPPRLRVLDDNLIGHIYLFEHTSKSCGQLPAALLSIDWNDTQIESYCVIPSK